MSETIADLVSSYGYLIVFALVGIESLGIPLPGETALVTAAAYAALGHLSIVFVIMSAAAGAIIGDNFGYWIGRKGGRSFVLRYGKKFHLKESHLVRAEAFFNKHGGKTVFIGRFVALLRSWAALLAGIGAMPYGEFTAYNAAGGIVWAALFGTLGYLFGKSLPTLEKYVGRASLALVLLAALVVTLLLAVRWLQENRTQVESAVARSREQHPKLASFLSARFARGEYLGLHLTIGMLVSVAGLWLFSGVTEDVLNKDPLTAFDLTLLQAFRAHASPLSDRIVSMVTMLGSPVAMGLLGLGVAVILAKRREWIVLSGWFAAFAGAGLLAAVLKIVVKRPRPVGAEMFLHGQTFSFPSGHALGSLVGYGMLAYLLIRGTHNRARREIIFFDASCLILAIGLSRLYLGVHYFSDVIGGYAAGSIWLAACISGLEIVRGRPVLSAKDPLYSAK